MMEPEKNPIRRALKRLKFYRVLTNATSMLRRNPSNDHLYETIRKYVKWTGAALCDEEVITDSEWDRVSSLVTRARFSSVPTPELGGYY